MNSFPLTGAQEALWLGRLAPFELGNVRPHRCIEIDVDDLDPDRFTTAWTALVARHEMLRAVVIGDGTQTINPTLSEYAVSTSLTSLPDGRTRIKIEFDLCMIDLDSVSVLGNDLRALYRGEALSEQSGPRFQEWAAASVSGPVPTDLPAAPQLLLVREPSAIDRPTFTRVERRIDAQTWTGLTANAQRAGTSGLAALAAVFGDALGNWCKEPRFTVLLAHSDRPSDAVGRVGNYLLLNPIDIDATPQRSIADRAGVLHTRMGDLAHSNGLEAVRELGRGGRPLAPAVPVVFLPRLAGEDLSGWTLDGGAIVSDRMELPQVLLAHEVIAYDGGLLVRWHCVEDLLPAGVLDELADCHLSLLNRLAASVDSWTQPSPEFLPQPQREVRDAANSTTHELPEVLLHELFWNQARKTPDAPAVIADERTLSYRELRAGATALAEQLRAVGARPNRMVAIVMEKGWQHPVAVMGILESGAAYVPVEPDLPEERFHYLLQHSEVDIAVVQAHLVDSLPWPDGVRRIVVDESMLEGEGVLESSRAQGQRDLAYVIYTSGSTGLPKGVMIDHRGALNTVLDINRKFNVGPQDRTLALTPLSFDLSVYDLFGLFAVGGAMVMPDAGTPRAPWHWADLCERHRVTIWNTVPALMEMLVGYTLGRRERLAESLRLVVMSGDWIAVSLPDRIRALAVPDIEIASLGGATEASIWSVFYRIGEVDPGWPSIPYGKPLANQSIEVLDQALRRRPDWVPGEQYVGGYGVAMGYWRDEEKTRRAFVTHPHTGERLYRTGDLGRCFPDGNVEFLGREDFQVKIHGYRIELGEIEAVLLSHENVTATVVTAIGSARGEKRLVAYVTGAADVAALEHHLAGKLPSHMIPAHIMVLDALPLTRNGKVDRQALPLPTSRKKAKYAPEQELTELEQRILDCWAEVGIGDLPVTGDPLEHGANSLQIAKVHHRLNAPELSLATMFQARSAREVAAALRPPPTAIS